ncbi:MAG: hypothetical protein ACOCT0_02625 [Halobacteriota archaeon]
MDVSVAAVPLLLAAGFLTAWVHKNWLVRRNKDSYVVLNVAFVLAFWLHAVYVATAGGVTPTTEIESTLVAVVYVLSYPLWFKFGAERAFILFGRTPSQGGATWVLRIKDKTESFEPNWED